MITYDRIVLSPYLFVEKISDEPVYYICSIIEVAMAPKKVDTPEEKKAAMLAVQAVFDK
jgi:hypothetical protein